uniref:ATP synthase F1 subunit epsilon n=1 Tax=Megaselia scalaris TaxID=36166 RepID=T1GV51_MEGSC
MFQLQRTSRFLPTVYRCCQMSGAGTIRQAGGSFGKMEAAHEEEYFRRKQFEALQKLHSDQIHQIEFHKHQIKEHQEAIKRHQEFITNLEKKN